MPLLVIFCHVAIAADDRFPINRVQVDGNTILPPADVDRAVGRAVGPQQAYGDIQRALEALELAYRKAGYSAVLVRLPEQELTEGVVKITVSESTVGRVTVVGNKYFDEANIRSSLRNLQVGRTPNLRAMSEAIQLANDNPAKQVEVTLASSTVENQVDAKITVVDSKPVRTTLTLDNTGTPATGKLRTGVSLQHANLFNIDHAATVAYTTSPDSPGGVHVNLFSVGYRVPLYAIGDSIDLLYGASSVNTPGASPTLGGLLGIVGKGNVTSLRWNHFFVREGTYTSKLVWSVDHKYINSRCSVNGVNVPFDTPTPAISSCVPYTTMPFGVTYFGRRQSEGEVVDMNVGVSRNLGTGNRYRNTSGRTDRYSYLTPGNRDTRDAFMTLHGGATYFKALPADWQVRLAANVQITSDPLVSSEQFGLVGAGAVRGFDERVVAADSGVIVNVETYTPELAGHLGVPGNLRLLAFLDTARGYNLRVGTGATPSAVTVAGAGFGLRYGAGRNIDVRADAARVVTAQPSVLPSRGQWKAHLGVVVGF